ncbi:MAG: PQQ-binding-like beta-propeller repeat protein [Pirellulaceae bacterium]
MRNTVTASAICLALLLASTVQAHEHEWTSFQNGGQPTVETSNLPVEWSPDSGITWQSQLAGYGQSSPLMWEDNIYVTSVSGDNKEKLHVQAISAADGSELWQFEAENSTPEENNNYVSRAAPTPVCDANGLIVFFEGGNVFALTHTGDVRWKLDLVALHGDVKARHSLASSLEQDEEHAFIWVERSTDPYVMAVRKSDGETVWRVPGLGVTSWSSPRLVPVGDGHHLVLSGGGMIAGYDPASGERLWEFDGVAGNSTPTPVPVGAGQFLIGASPGRSEGESGNAARSNGVVQITGEDGNYAASWLWQAKRATSSFGSPMVHQGRAYFVNRQGVVYCLDVETGDEIFAGRTSGGSVWATPLGAGDFVYLFGKEGTTTVLESAADELVEYATNQLWSGVPQASEGEGGGQSAGPVLYAATPIDSGLLLRRGDTLYLVGGNE